MKYKASNEKQVSKYRKVCNRYESETCKSFKIDPTKQPNAHFFKLISMIILIGVRSHYYAKLPINRAKPSVRLSLKSEKLRFPTFCGKFIIVLW